MHRCGAIELHTSRSEFWQSNFSVGGKRGNECPSSQLWQLGILASSFGDVEMPGSAGLAGTSGTALECPTQF